MLTNIFPEMVESLFSAKAWLCLLLTSSKVSENKDAAASAKSNTNPVHRSQIQEDEERIPRCWLEELFKIWYSFVIDHSGFKGFWNNLFYFTFLNVKSGEMVGEGWNYDASDMPVWFVWHKNMVNERGRGVVYTSVLWLQAKGCWRTLSQDMY